MRKADIIESIAEKTGVPKVDVIVVFESILKEIKQNLTEGNPIFIRGFGTFTLKTRAAKIGRNVRTNIAIQIPEHNIPSFKPAKEFKEQVKFVKISSATKLKNIVED